MNNRCIITALKCFIVLGLIASMASCESCNRGEARDGKLLMKLTKPHIMGDKEKTFHIKISPQDPQKIVEYKNYKLRISLSAESGRDLKGSKLRYKSFDKAGKESGQEVTSFPFTKDLSHFFIGAVLEPGDNPLEKDFMVEPSLEANKLFFKIELLDATAQDAVVVSEEGMWERETLPTFEIENTNKDKNGKIVGDKKVQLLIKKPNTSTEITFEELSKIALSIKRIRGDKARIGTPPDDEPSYILSPVNATLNADKMSASLELAIEPGTDKRAEFELQVVNKEVVRELLGSVQTVKWENGARLDLQIGYDDTDPANKKVNIAITNIGILALPANKAVLSWDTGDDDITLQSNSGAPKSRQSSQQLQEIPADGSAILLSLEHVTFANDKVAGNLVVKLTWDELENPESRSCLLTAVPVDVTFTQLEFDKATDQIKYNIKNNGKEDIVLQLQATNGVQGNQSVIDAVLPVNFNLSGAGQPGSESGQQALQVDFKDEDRADFNIALMLDGHPIDFKYNNDSREKVVRTAAVQAVAKQVKLKLVDETNNGFAGNELLLRGANKEIKFKVALDGVLNDVVALNAIGKNKLKLTIDKNNAGDAKLMHQGYELKESILGADLELGTDNNVELVLERGNSSEATFVFRLMYDKKGTFQSIGDPLTVEWEEDKFKLGLDLGGKRMLLADAIGAGKLKNKTSDMDPTTVALVLKSDNEDVKFCFVDEYGNRINDVGGGKIENRATLEQLVGNNNPNNQIAENTPIKFYFKLEAATDGQKTAELNVAVERENKEIIIYEPIYWGATEADILKLLTTKEELG